MPLDINSEEFTEKVLRSNKAALVDFWADWCMPCRMMAPVLEELAADQDIKEKLDIYKVNTEIGNNHLLAAQYNVMSIPNLKLFRSGVMIAEFIGLRSTASFKQELLGALA